jgi:hypothetical protein
VVLADDRRGAGLQAPLARHQLRQLRDRDRLGLAREAARPGGVRSRVG